MIFEVILCLFTVAGSLYVSPSGNDSDDGSLNAPFASLQHCVNQLPAHGPGSSCVLRQGRYQFTKAVRVYGLHGKDGAPYTIAAMEGEDVVIDGSVEVKGPWVWSTSACPTGCWHTDLPSDVKPWQLFLDGDMLTPARWPNALWSDKTIFDASHWGVSASESTFEGGKFIVGRTDAGGGLRTQDYGDSIMVDATKKCDRRLAECTHSGCANEMCHPDSGSLGSARLPTGEPLNVTGATAIMNLGSWTTHAAVVKAHMPGSNNFTYRAAEDWPVRKFVPEHNIYFLENKLELLDAPTEWFFDQASSRLYLKSPDDANPTGRVRARVQEYAIMIRDASYLTVRGLKFFATSLYATAQQHSHLLQNCRFESLEFKFAGGMRRMLGELEHASPMVLWSGWNSLSGNNTIFNSVYFGIDGWPLFTNFMNGQITISNCLFQYIDWTCMHAKHPKKFHDDDDDIEYHTYWGDSYTLVAGDGKLDNPNLWERNTIIHHGSSEGLQVKDNTVVRLNRIGYKYSLQNDGALIQTSGHELTEPGSVLVKQNWVHDSVNIRNAKWGIRADRVQTRCVGGHDANTWPFNVHVEENVVWRTLGINLKGNNHVAHRNTILWPGGKGNDEASDSATGGLNIYNYQNSGTCTCGSTYCIANPDTCCVEGESSTFEGMDTVATQNAFSLRGTLRGGTEHYPRTEHVDASIGVPGATYNSAGATEDDLRDPLNFDFRPKPGSYLASTCIGAYDALGHGGHYWIPGRKGWTSSFPIPPNGAEAKLDVDLMFLGGLGAVGHHIYASTVSPSNLQYLGTLSGDANIVTPASLGAQPGDMMYWRVDAFDDAGVRTGPIWNFSISSPEPIDTSTTDCRIYSAKDTPATVLNGEKRDASFMTIPAASSVYASRVKVKSWRVCVNFTAAVTLSNWHIRTVARYGKGAAWAMHFSELDGWNNPAGIADRYLQACFDDDATEYLPSATNWDAARPFTGTWRPRRALLSQFADNNHVIEDTRVDYRLKVFDRGSGVGGSVLEGWSTEVCVEKLPAPSPVEWPNVCPRKTASVAISAVQPAIKSTSSTSLKFLAMTSESVLLSTASTTSMLSKASNIPSESTLAVKTNSAEILDTQSLLGSTLSTTSASDKQTQLELQKGTVGIAPINENYQTTTGLGSRLKFNGVSNAATKVASNLSPNMCMSAALLFFSIV